jgi:GAF domain-containing protein
MGGTTLLRKEIRAIWAIAEVMNATLNWQEVLSSTMRILVEELGYKGASVRLLDQERKTLVLQAAHGLSQTYLDKGGVELAHSVIDQEVVKGRAMAVHDVARAPGLQYPEAAAREGICSVLAVPLYSQERVTGVLRVYTGEPHDFEQDEQDFLQAVANLIARAITNVHLYEALQTIAREVNSTLKVEKVLNSLLENTVRELNYKAAAIRLLGPRGKRLHLVASYGLSEEYLAKGEVRVEDSPVDREVLRGQPITIYDIMEEARVQYPREAIKEGIRSMLVVPLRAQEKIIGVLRVYSAQPHRFSREEVAFVDFIASLGAIALENARLHEALGEKYQALKIDADGWYRFLALS